MHGLKKFFLIFVFLVLDAALLIGFLEIGDAVMKNRLKNEAAALLQLDLTKDRYHLRTKTVGDCAVVEKAMKEYLDSIAVLLQDTLGVMNDEELLHILSYENYVDDGPEFKNSFAYLEKEKKHFNENVDSLLLKLGENSTREFIRGKTKKSYLWDLYEEYMLNGDFRGYFQETSDLLEQTKIRVNDVFDTSRDVLILLSSHKASWVLEEGEIRFRQQSFYQQYLNYIAKINQ